MAFALVLRALASRSVRGAILRSAGLTVRTIWKVVKSPVTWGGLARIWGSFRRFGGFLIKRVGLINLAGAALTFTALWGDIVSLVQFIWNFNWNAKDEELDAAVKASAVALAGRFGGLVGQSLGYLVCGAVPNSLIFAFNEPLALYVLEELTDEAIDELAATISALINQTGAFVTRAAFTWIYKNIRSLVRESTPKFKQRLISAGVKNEEELQKAVTEREKPWSFALATEEFLEKTIPNDILRNGVEELLEEFAESCIEAGYVIAGRMDSFLAEARVASGGVLGPDRTVEILFNRTPSAAPGPNAP